MTNNDDNKSFRLTTGDFTELPADPHVPFDLFGRWLDEAWKSEPNDAHAMSVATVDEKGMPNVRILLLKGYDEEGFVFYTNFESRKGREILATPSVALNFHWKTLKRQVRLRGPVEQVSDTEADDYYNSRPEGSRIGAWASQQSRPLDSRKTLEDAVAAFTKRYENLPIPRPPYWSGFRLKPLSIEFWHDREFRLHDRIVFERDSVDDRNWTKHRLYP